jgi:hypothetical protein
VVRVTHAHTAADLQRRGADVERAVLSGAVEWHNHGESYTAPLLAAALAGGATLAGAGLNPGFVAERLALLLTGLVARLDEVRCYETFDASLSPSAGLVFDVMGFGVDPARTDVTTGELAKVYDALYAETFGYVAERLGTSVVSVLPEYNVTLAPEDLTLRAGTVPAGTVAAQVHLWGNCAPETTYGTSTRYG